MQLKGRTKAFLRTAFAAAVLVFSVFMMARSVAADSEDGPPLRVGYCQYGAYYEFDYEIYRIGMALMERGEIESDRLSSLSQGDSAALVWEALADARSESFSFVGDAFLDIARGEFEGLPDESIGPLLAKRIAEEDLDLMITMGTTAGLFVKEATDVPYMNFIASDPVSSEITGGVEYSGSDRAFAHVSTDVEIKALTVMYDIFAPKRLGIVYSDNDDAYIYSGAASVDSFSEEKGLTVERRFVSDYFEDTREGYEEYRDNLRLAHEELAESGIDLYILTASALEPQDFVPSLAPFVERGIPVFSINSTEDVRFGALAAVEMFDYENIGRFAADRMVQYRRGAKLSELSQVYETAPFLVINLDTMRSSGIRLTFDALISASKIYRKYEGE